MSACQKNILTRSFFLSAILFESTLLDRAVATIQPCPPVSDSTAHDRESPEDVALHPRLFFPKLCSLIDRARSSSAAVEANLAEELASSPLSSTYRSPDFAEFPATNMLRTSRRAAENGPSVRDPDPIPIVMAHGLGDSCFNRGLQKLANLTSSQTGRATWCVPQGDTRNRDVIASFLVSMDDTVDAFAEQVRSDPRTADGFDAIGFSQGCNIVRGYIAKYNDPPVRTFMSVNGVNAGVAGKLQNVRTLTFVERFLPRFGPTVENCCNVRPSATREQRCRTALLAVRAR
uniref:Palmitoyl-protein thioesterase 1 n=1 Tax=Corethron hystrix TaxID=216773 RepID=A0A7S1BCK1_9STRA|mmetsp:Transcript_21130/g.47912  ORF Transcript_21130/g.47912 Transcript_21130/m.47912 type:complete len:289 (+) Transcript_21130:84-950(+)